MRVSGWIGDGFMDTSDKNRSPQKSANESRMSNVIPAGGGHLRFRAAGINVSGTGMKGIL